MHELFSRPFGYSYSNIDLSINQVDVTYQRDPRREWNQPFAYTPRRWYQDPRLLHERRLALTDYYSNRPLANLSDCIQDETPG